MNTKDTILSISDKYELKNITEKINKFKATEENVNVAFLGEFSSGKTSLINALLKKKFLPMFDKPTTAVITEIKSGDKNKFEVVATDIDGSENRREISVSNLAEEVQKDSNNNRIEIEIKNTELLDEKTVLIDTPGVASINDTHSDVTYGYLPTVDVAFVVVNVNMGSISKGLEQFINQYPDDIKSKIYFVLTHVDTKSEAQVEKLENEFKTALSPIIANPKIFKVSSKKAIEGNTNNNTELYQRSGVAEIANVISNEIPQYKLEVQRKKENEFLKQCNKDLLVQLETIKDGLSYNSEEYDQEIKTISAELEKLQRAEKSLKQELQNTKNDITLNARRIAANITPEILSLMTQNGDISESIVKMVDGIQRQIELGLDSLEKVENPTLDEQIKNSVLQSIEQEFRGTFETANSISGIANMALTAYIGGGTGVAGNLLEMGIGKLLNDTAETSKSTSTTKSTNTNTAKGSSFKSMAGSFINQLNIIGRGKDFLLEKTMSDKINFSLQNKASEQVNIAFNYVEKSLSKVLDSEYLQPINEKQEALKAIRGQRNNSFDQIDASKQAIKNDIQQLQVLSL
ncbi:dynamin family protein [Flammeovirga yaeyamensis]|uniref:Dynamin family protein n=1 Tax=Flammeovirga yaeyamensis TaxID=367791 RepID=A0AAX1N382_9BACT|nr:dynamin family protein [Flammeovirga yaeyamensis]MBB3701201.1 GTPase SAR1 family protein [Flammeovirga yaeyamensis]NMF38473.1 hypothetical protein [Flammeovirga yaeyamensis]QWG01667.1 dynamin family protein [Flammeovirga yaeyamensis]